MVAYDHRLSQAHTRKQILMLAILYILGIVAIALLVIWWAASKLPPSACTGDCNQGRDCTCTTRNDS